MRRWAGWALWGMASAVVLWKLAEHRWPLGEGDSWLWLGGILGFNWLMYGIAAAFPDGQQRGSGPAAGLLWVTVKLFVNTLTIFFVIGLHVGYDPLFLPLFLTGFVLLMIGGIAMLQLKHVRQTRAISSHE